MRYVVIKNEQACDDYDLPLVLNHLTVDDGKYIPTGILSPDGDMIYTLPIPIGFGRDNEW